MGEVEIVEVYEFDGRYSEDEAGPGLSTVDAMRRVRFGEDSDLRASRVYSGESFARVMLIKHYVPNAGAQAVVLVVDAATYLAVGGRVTEDDALGCLRPVQRYVVQRGLDRAALLDEEVVERLREEGNDWGFALIRGIPHHDLVSITPPIVERLHPVDRVHPDERSFIVCDGNHRVVSRVWMAELPLAAVAVLDPPTLPYYAHPQDALAWHQTADNVCDEQPPLTLKLKPRVVTESDVGSAAWEAHVRHMPEPHRRYFRDFSTGFGGLGGQAGKERP